ncbi:Ankyrin repeat domain-containing protein 50 [Geodia barretti]|uniref:Ankyrin repeat domain-containing protein 50 n=1 Tax=Geodia barretti TaxID=519541 RepID=A0AA35TFD7_GEOBA|nr:Ankyrin repeat domain-containing protein 50 [Geodia barretti]
MLKSGANVNLTTVGLLSSPLEVAAGKGHTEIVEKLISAGAVINYQNKDGVTPLLIASQEGHLEVVRLLLMTGAKDLPYKDGRTAMSVARAKGHQQIVQLLQQYKV